MGCLLVESCVSKQNLDYRKCVIHGRGYRKKCKFLPKEMIMHEKTVPLHGIYKQEHNSLDRYVERERGEEEGLRALL